MSACLLLQEIEDFTRTVDLAKQAFREACEAGVTHDQMVRHQIFTSNVVRTVALNRIAVMERATGLKLGRLN